MHEFKQLFNLDPKKLLWKIFSVNCTAKLGTFNGFLHQICQEDTTLLKCMFSNEYYRAYPAKIIDWIKAPSVDLICSNDPHYYQGCGLQDKYQHISNAKKTFCGCICQSRDSSRFIFFQGPMGTYRSCEDWLSCGSLYQCSNFVEYQWGDHQKCSEGQELVQLQASMRKLTQDEICDGVCHWETGCEDEAFCNGFHYGMYCYFGANHTPMYLAPDEIVCSSLYDHSWASDFRNRSLCDLDLKTICQENTQFCFKYHKDRNSSYDERYKVPLLNLTRCTSSSNHDENFSGEFHRFKSICADGLDQTNCSDPIRIAGWCLIGNYLSSVSRSITCPEEQFVPVLCDDGIEKECVTISFSCHIHKHKLCDQIFDCSDMTDELAEICASMSPKKCIRKFGGGKREQNFPISWITDGVEDCMGGEDELLNWETCGQGPSLRYKRENSSCSEVFFCLLSKSNFIELEQLCDKVETCQNENKICEVSHSNIPAYNLAARLDSPLDSDSEVFFVRSFCLPGLENVQYHMHTSCETKNFISSTNTFVGRDTYPRIQLISTTEQECQHLYGEQYVYSSCMGRCKDAVCPLTRNLTYSSCPGQYPDRVLGLFDRDSLTFVTSSRGRFVNDYFLCENTQCVEYHSVCDLVDNCGDGSDERNCSNHFACQSGDSYVAVSQMCDGVTNCFDFSDECNDSCGKEIINGIALKVTAFLMGSSALILNLISVIHNLAGTLRKNCSKPMFVDKVFTSAIGLGDLMVGLYLLSLSMIDQHYGAGYCELQNEWLTSNYCSALGVLSTFGSQLSLFSVAILSVNRMVGVHKTIVPPEMASTRTKHIVLIFLASTSAICLTIAVLPLLPWLEDSFVNGVVYERSNRLFNGVVTKDVHVKIFKEFFGKARFKGAPSWRLIRKLVDGMFSRDYGGIEQKTLNFFGNDGVCLFKYIVKQNDPQRIFVWLTLGINFICVLSTVASYITIALVSKRSGKVMKECNHVDQARLKRQNLLQRKVSLIVVTDLLCWIPFLIICVLHFCDVMNAVPLYSFLSIVVLPINSVVNPIFYCNTTFRAIDKVLGWVSLQAFELGCLFGKCKFTVSQDGDKGKPEEIAMHNMNAQPCLIVNESVVNESNPHKKCSSMAKTFTDKVSIPRNRVVKNLKLQKNVSFQSEVSSLDRKRKIKTDPSIVLQNRMRNPDTSPGNVSGDIHEKTSAVKYVCETEEVIFSA